jgi:THO complex subunit 2
MEVAFTIVRPALQVRYPSADPIVYFSSTLEDGQLQARTPEEVDSFLSIVRNVVPPSYQALSEFIGTFWWLSLRDIYVPQQVYQEQIQSHRNAIETLEVSSRGGDVTRSQLQEISKKKQDHQQQIQNLVSELPTLEQHNRKVLDFLNQRKKEWFTAFTNKDQIVSVILQVCVFPRLLHSFEDALYCAKFVHMLHSIAAPDFFTLFFLNKCECWVSPAST